VDAGVTLYDVDSGLTAADVALMAAAEKLDQLTD
jgi:hypothetical protein